MSEAAKAMWSEERVRGVREQFPILRRQANGRPLVYLDNAATSQVPRCVTDTLVQHLCYQNANIHRGAHTLGEEATEAYEHARAVLARFIHAPKESYVIFTSGTTQGINLVARGLEGHLRPGLAVLVTALEHHSNYLPWQQLCERTGAQLRVAGLNERGEICAERLCRLLEDGRVRICALTACSNVTGAVTQLEPLIRAAHRSGALVLVDAAQAARALPLDARALGADFLALSGHKMCAPTGTGVLYGTAAALNELQLTSFGGGMVDGLRGGEALFSALPERLEAGTPNSCTSNAWMELAAEEGLLHVRMSSDSLLIKGLLGVVTLFVQDRPCAEVAAWDPRFLEHPQLKRQLNIDRRQGMRSIVSAIRAFSAL